MSCPATRPAPPELPRGGVPDAARREDEACADDPAGLGVQGGPDVRDDPGGPDSHDARDGGGEAGRRPHSLRRGCGGRRCGGAGGERGAHRRGCRWSRRYPFPREGYGCRWSRLPPLGEGYGCRWSRLPQTAASVPGCLGADGEPAPDGAWARGKRLRLWPSARRRAARRVPGATLRGA